MKFIFHHLLLFFLLNSCQSSPTWSQLNVDELGLENFVSLHSDEYYLYWSVRNEEIIIGVEAKTLGWVGFGVSSNGGMKGADMVIFSEENGEDSVGDYISREFQRPSKDENQSIEIMTFGRSNGTSYFVFKRTLKPCDPEDLEIIPEHPQWLIYAFGEDSEPSLQYHESNRGNLELQLLKSNETVNIPLDAEEFVITTNPIVVPSSKTNYFCSVHSLPDDQKYHVVQVDPVVNNTLVHHMILYACIENDVPLSNASTCGAMKQECIDFWVGWGVGGSSIIYPNIAGLPMGNGTTTRVLLEIHYNNPDGVSGIVDASGFKLVYTPTLRPSDIGTLILGTTLDVISIPPRQSAYEIQNECPQECTALFPSEGINVIYNGFHMHNFGKRIWTQHIRDGKELEPLGQQKFWDFNYQSPTPTLKKILPGDSLITHCQWDTSTMDTIVRGGEESDDEMCFNFVQYYPLMKKKICLDVTYRYPGVAVCAEDTNLDAAQNNIQNNIVFFQPVEYSPLNITYVCEKNTALDPDVTEDPPNFACQVPIYSLYLLLILGLLLA